MQRYCAGWPPKVSSIAMRPTDDLILMSGPRGQAVARRPDSLAGPAQWSCYCALLDVRKRALAVAADLLSIAAYCDEALY